MLEQTYMVRLLPPFEANIKKRLVRSPKLYLRDSGVLHALLGIEGFDELLGHPAVGESWEGLAIEQLIAALPRWRPAFLRTGNGAEVDLVMERAGRLRLFEIKLSKAPKPSRGFFQLVEELGPEQAWVVAPVDAPYEVRKGVWVSDLGRVVEGVGGARG